MSLTDHSDPPASRGRYYRRAREVYRENERLREEVAFYRAKLNIEQDPPELVFMRRFGATRKQALLLGALLAASPRYLNAYALDEALPPLDRARDREINHVRVAVCYLRKRLPPGAIETVHGIGWRISPDFRAALAA